MGKHVKSLIDEIEFSWNVYDFEKIVISYGVNSAVIIYDIANISIPKTEAELLYVKEGSSLYLIPLNSIKSVVLA